MPLLNQTTSFDQQPMSARSAFRNMQATKIMLNAGSTLFRFSGGSHISPWWSQTRQLAHLLLSAQSSGGSLYNHVRRTNAVLRDWDAGMFNLIVGELTTPVYAFSGTSGPQCEGYAYMADRLLKNHKKHFTKAVFFGGGNGQLYIPGLSQAEIKILVPPGVVNIYDKPDDIMDFLISYRLI